MLPHKRKPTCSGIIVIVCLILVVPSLSNLSKAEWPLTPTQDWNVTGSETYQDRDLTPEGSIYIYARVW
jgi:hypothetical protein